MHIVAIHAEKQKNVYQVEIPAFNASFECVADNEMKMLGQAADFIKGEILKKLLIGEEVIPASILDAENNTPRWFTLAVQVDLPKDNLFTIGEVQRILGVTQPRVSHLIRDKRLIAQKDGRRRLITRASLEAYLKTPRKAGRPTNLSASQFDYATSR